jgi:hypothetical protein
MSKTRTVVDIDSGEILIIPEPKKPKKGGWCRMFQVKLEELSKDKELRGMPKDIFLYMVSQIGYDNICKVPQVKLAREFDTTPQYISKIIKLLKSKKMIIEINEEGAMKSYKFNSSYVVKGKLEGDKDGR